MDNLELAQRGRVVDLSAVIERLSGKALGTIEELMSASAKDDVRLRASQDILDRNPKTSKTQKLAISSLSLTGKDVDRLASALVASSGLREQFAAAAQGDYTPGLSEPVVGTLVAHPNGVAPESSHANDKR
jgi:hypothetical protein